MPVISLIAPKNGILRKFFDETHERINTADFAKSPFSGGVSFFSNPGEKTMLVVLDIKIAYPKELSLIGLVASIGAMIITRQVFSWWIAPGLAIFCLRFLWSEPFWRFMLGRGIAKHVGKVDIEYLSNKESLRWLLKWGK